MWRKGKRRPLIQPPDPCIEIARETDPRRIGPEQARGGLIEAAEKKNRGDDRGFHRHDHHEPERRILAPKKAKDQHIFSASCPAKARIAQRRAFDGGVERIRYKA